MPDADDVIDPFLAFADVALRTTAERMPEVDQAAMTMVMLLHRVNNSLVYDLESTVHRPAGWSWSAFRLLFTLWVAGPSESSRAAELTGMSRAAVSSLANTLSASGLLARTPGATDGRAVVLSLSEAGGRALEEAFRAHNQREAEWSHLLTPDELTTFNSVLAKLVRAAQAEPWVNHRA